MAGFLPHAEPYVVILEQPAPWTHRFRYEREVEGRSAGAIVGISSTEEAKTYPKIKVMNYRGPYCVMVSCVTDDLPYRPHPNKLVGRNCRDGIFSTRVDDPDMTYSFKGLGVQCAKKKDVESNLRERKKRKMDPFRTGFSDMTDMSRSVLRLCFQVFIPQADNSYAVLQPVVSESIRDQRTVSSLTITKLSHFSAPVTGGTDVIILCERILGDDVQIWFYETRNSRVEWEVQAEFKLSDVHKKVAISFQIPRYRNENIEHSVQVFIQLRRSLDTQERGAPRPFYFTPKQNAISEILPRKIRKVLKFIERNKQFLDPEGCNAEAAQRPDESICRIPVPRTISQRNLQYEELSNASGNPFSPASSSSLNLTSQSQPITSSTSFVFPSQSTNFTVQSKYKRRSLELSNSVNSPFSPASPTFNVTSQSQPKTNPSTTFLFPDRSRDFSVSSKCKRNSLELNPFTSSSNSFNLTSQPQPMARPSSFVFPDRPTDFVTSSKYKRKSLELSDTMTSPFSSVSASLKRKSLDLSMRNPFPPASPSLNLTSQNDPTARLSASFGSPVHSAGFDIPPEVYRKSIELSATVSDSSSLNMTSESESAAGESTSSESTTQSAIFDMPHEVYNQLLELSAAQRNAFLIAPTSLKSQIETVATSFNDPSTDFDMSDEAYCQALGLLSTESYSFSQASTSHTENRTLNSTLQTEHVVGTSTSSIDPSTIMSPYTQSQSLETFSSIIAPIIQQELAASELSYENDNDNDLTSLLSDSFSSITLDYEFSSKKHEK